MMPYVIVFALYITLIHFTWKYGYSKTRENFVFNTSSISLFLVSSLPIILFFGLRVNVGTDYHSYIRHYHRMKTISLLDYMSQFSFKKIDNMEPAYYLINRIAYLIYDNEHTMFLLAGILLFGTFYIILGKYENFSRSYATFVFLMTQFFYTVNGMRFALAYMVVLLGIKYIIEEKPIKFLACILVAMMFHKSAICCILFYFLKRFKNLKINKIRNSMLYIGIAFTPYVTKILLKVASRIPILESYFREYHIQLTNGDYKFLFRCAPLLISVLLLIKLYHIKLNKYDVLLNVALCRIPLLYLGYYMTWASRLERYAWISEIILVPYILYHIKNRRQRWLVGLLLALWYFAISFYYYVMRTTDLFPYKSVF